MNEKVGKSQNWTTLNAKVCIKKKAINDNELFCVKHACMNFFCVYCAFQAMLK